MSNLYILKSKGTKKSLKAFLRSYGVNENLVKINLYSDHSSYNAVGRTYLTTAKKKTITLQNSSSIFLTSSIAITSQTSSYTIENGFMFGNSLEQQAPYSSSLFGFSFSNSNRSYTPFTAYSYIHNDQSGSRFYFATSSAVGSTIVGSSSYFQNLYDNTPWTLAFRLKTGMESTDADYLSALTSYPDDILELTGTNKNGDFDKSFSISVNLQQNFFRSVWLSNAPYLNFYVGAKNQNLSGSNQIPTYIKSVYCNIWDSNLSDGEIISHNEDITNYGADN